jgi:hypothetical protein
MTTPTFMMNPMDVETIHDVAQFVFDRLERKFNANAAERAKEVIIRKDVCMKTVRKMAKNDTIDSLVCDVPNIEHQNAFRKILCSLALCREAGAAGARQDRGRMSLRSRSPSPRRLHSRSRSPSRSSLTSRSKPVISVSSEEHEQEQEMDLEPSCPVLPAATDVVLNLDDALKTMDGLICEASRTARRPRLLQNAVMLRDGKLYSLNAGMRNLRAHRAKGPDAEYKTYRVLDAQVASFVDLYAETAEANKDRSDGWARVHELIDEWNGAEAFDVMTGEMSDLEEELERAALSGAGTAAASPASPVQESHVQEPSADAIKEAVRLATLRAEGLSCAIDRSLLFDPVTLIGTGQTYNRYSIKSHLEFQRRSERELTCPFTKKPLPRNAKVVTNYAMNNQVAVFVEEFGDKEGPEWAEIRQLCDEYKTNEAARAAANAPMSPVCTSAYFEEEAGPAYSPIRATGQSPTNPNYSATSPVYDPLPARRRPYRPYSPRPEDGSDSEEGLATPTR